LPVAGCQLPVAGCQLPVASCQLPVKPVTAHSSTHRCPPTANGQRVTGNW
jgi:hypothetical protein